MFIKSDFRDMFLKPTLNGQSDKAFLLASKFGPPRGCLPLPRGYIHVEKHLKICIKSELKEFFLKLATNGGIDKAFLLASNF